MNMEQEKVLRETIRDAIQIVKKRKLKEEKIIILRKYTKTQL